MKEELTKAINTRGKTNARRVVAILGFELSTRRETPDHRTEYLAERSGMMICLIIKPYDTLASYC